MQTIQSRSREVNSSIQDDLECVAAPRKWVAEDQTWWICQMFTNTGRNTALDLRLPESVQGHSDSQTLQ